MSASSSHSSGSLQKSGKADQLAHAYTFYYALSKGRNKNWDWKDCFHTVEHIYTVKEFWKIVHTLLSPAKLLANEDYYFFKSDVKPMWEDARNRNGGRIVLWLRKRDAQSRQVLGERLNRCWVEVLMAMIGEQFGSDSDYICGAAVCIRHNADKICLWIAGNSSPKCTERIRKVFRDVVGLEQNERLEYELHSKTAKRYHMK